MSTYKKMFAVLAVLFSTALFGVAEAAAPSTTAPSSKPHQYQRIFYYRDSDRALSSFLENIKSIDVIAPQAYAFNASGTLSGSVNPSIMYYSAKSGIKVMPLVTNGAFTQSSLRTLLDDPEKQKEAAEALVAEAKKEGYWGWQVDFEQIGLADRSKFSAFIETLGQALKRNDLVLSVAVIAQVSEDPADYPKNLWERIIGAYDYAALASSTDFISIMSYDDPESKGPVARYSWLKRIIDHSLKYIPNEKISLGIPLYYWKWNAKTGKLVGIGGYEGIENTLKKYKVASSYSALEQAATIKYTVKKVPYTIWYENAASIKKKLELVTKNKLHGFSAWALGLETPEIHTVVAR